MKDFGSGNPTGELVRVTMVMDDLGMAEIDDSLSRTDELTAGKETFLPIDLSLSDYVPAALVRVGYLFSGCVFSSVEGGVRIVGSYDPSSLRREVLHAVYRERIFAETLPLRRRLIDGLLS